MKAIKFVWIVFALFTTQLLISQTQKLVSIEMYHYSKWAPSNSGSGVSTYTASPFIVKTTDANGEVTEKIYEAEHWRRPIETMPYLRQEIDLWLSNGYKLFSFNVTATGETSSSFRYLVLLVKEE